MNFTKQCQKVSPSYALYRSPSLLQSLASTGTSPPMNGISPCIIPHFQSCAPSPAQKLTAAQATSPIKEEDWKKFRSDILSGVDHPPVIEKANDGSPANDERSPVHGYDRFKHRSNTYCPVLTLSLASASGGTVPPAPPTLSVPSVLPVGQNNNTKVESTFAPGQKGLRKVQRKVSSFLEQDGTPDCSPSAAIRAQMAAIEEAKGINIKGPVRVYGKPSSQAVDKKNKENFGKVKNDRTAIMKVYGTKKISVYTPKNFTLRRAETKKEGVPKKAPSTPPRKKSELSVIPEAPHKVLCDESTDIVMEESTWTNCVGS